MKICHNCLKLSLLSFILLYIYFQIYIAFHIELHKSKMQPAANVDLNTQPSQNIAMDQKIYKILQQQDQQKDQANPQQNNQYGPSFIVHLVFKAVPIALMLLRGLLMPLIGKTIVIQLILLFVVLDFWLTKNITGKRMIGIRWGFEENQYGDQKFQFQGRVNEEYVSPLSSKIFWLILLVYTIIPIVFLVIGILSFVGRTGTQFEDLLLYSAIIAGGGINLFFFWRASQGVNKRRNELNNKLGNQFVNQMGSATVVSYL